MCGGCGELFFNSTHQEFYKCETCEGLFVPPALLPEAKSEITRYKSHHNDVHDIRYQKFVSPIVNAVLKDFDSGTHTGLDYGAGTGPVITKMLRDHHYDISPYDPFFDNNKSLLEKHYNFIVCCEVMEHFHRPAEEFRRLKNLLLPGGKLYCMTHLYSQEIDFQNWYYKNDPTHVFIYRKETLDCIVRKMDFAKVEIDKRLIVFSLQEKENDL